MTLWTARLLCVFVFDRLLAPYSQLIFNSLEFDEPIESNDKPAEAALDQPIHQTAREVEPDIASDLVCAMRSGLVCQYHNGRLYVLHALVALRESPKPPNFKRTLCLVRYSALTSKYFRCYKRMCSWSACNENRIARRGQRQILRSVVACPIIIFCSRWGP